MKQSSRQENTTFKLLTDTNLRIDEYKHAHISEFCISQVLCLLKSKMLTAVLEFSSTMCLSFYSQEEAFVNTSLYRHI